MKKTLVIALLLAVRALGQGGLQPISNEHLKDGKLISTEENFSITPPPGQWRWFEHRNEKDSVASYTGVDSEKGTVISVTVTRKIFPHMDDKFMAGVVEGVRKATVAAGGTVEIGPIGKSDKPIPGARTFASTVTYRGREPLGTEALVFKRGYMYFIQTMSHDDPASTLAAVADSFTLLTTPPVSTAKFTTGLMTGSFACFLVVLLAMAINAAAKRRILNGAAGSAYLMLLYYVVTCALLAIVIDREADPGAQGEAFGELFGAVLIPLIVAIVFARRFEVQRVQERIRARLLPGPVKAGSTGLGISLFVLGGLLIATNFPESRMGITALAIAQLLFLWIGVVAFVRHARKGEIARLNTLPIVARSA